MENEIIRDEMDIKETEHTLLIRIDERLKGLILRMESFNKKLSRFEILYITRKEFAPVRNIIFSMVGIILVTVFIAIIKTVLDNSV